MLTNHRGIKCCQPGFKRLAAGIYHEFAAHVCGADRVDGFERYGKGLRKVSRCQGGKGKREI